ncbi:MAG: phosphotransferase [Prevotellaceae bacterium]|nr:phosphotransferase [Prevotellaceae bacterium]
MSVVSYTINPDYTYLRDFLESVPLFFASSEGEVLQDGRNLIKVFTAPDGTRLNIKRYHQPKGINKFVYSWGIRKPKGKRAYLYSDILLSHGIDTPRSVAYIEERHCGMIGYSYYVSLQCHYTHKCYELGDAAPSMYIPFAKALAAFTAKIHEAGLLHRDYSPGNILWEQTQQGYQFALVDTNQMHFGHISQRMGCRNFARLWGQKDFFSLLAREYAAIRGFNPDECEKQVLAARRKFWKRYMRKKKDKIKFNLEL